MFAMRPDALLAAVVMFGAAGTVATRATQDPALHLSKSLQDASAHYANDAEALRRASTDAGLCNVLEESRDLGRALSRSIDTRRDAITANDLDLTATTTGVDKQKQDFDAALRTLSSALPGVFIADGDAVRFGPDYSALADVARDPPDKRLLELSGQALHDNSPLTFSTPPEGAHCTDLEKALAQVDDLGKAWGNAAACLQPPLADELDAHFGMLAGARYPGKTAACFCQKKDEAKQLGPKLADAIQARPFLGGQRNADYLRKTLDASDTQFDCR